MRELAVLLKILELKNLENKISLFDNGEGNIVLIENKGNWIVFNKVEEVETNRIIHLTLNNACIDILERIDKSLVNDYLNLCNAIRR